MTRINLIPVEEMYDQHLIAEHREIKRIPNQIRNGKLYAKDIPECFTLGKGHVKFFSNKMGFLANRYTELYRECVNRGFNVECYSDSFTGLDDSLYNDYIPTEDAIALSRERIKEKYKPNFYRVRGVII